MMKTPAPFSTRESRKAAFATHVSPGKVQTFEAFGLDIVMGRRVYPFLLPREVERRV